MLKLHLCGRSNRHHNLVSRVQLICDNHNVSLLKYVLDNTNANQCKSKIKAFKTSDGIIDSAAHLLTDFNAHNRETIDNNYGKLGFKYMCIIMTLWHNNTNTCSGGGGGGEGFWFQTCHFY